MSSLTRREFLRTAVGAALTTAGTGGLASFLVTHWCQVNEVQITLPTLPRAFDGLRIGFIADTHFGPWMTVRHLQEVIALTQAAKPDLIALGGDYLTRRLSRGRGRAGFGAADRRRIEFAIAAHAGLSAPLGVYAVLGNHDHWESGPIVREALTALGYRDLTNDGVWFERNGARLRLAGVDDMWEGKPNFMLAAGDATEADCLVLLSHNPEMAERIHDRRVSLILSGHTHGGQVVLPWIGPPLLPTTYGQKYASGLVRGPICPVFVTRGVGVIAPPVRFRCPAEVSLIILRAGNGVS